MDFNMGTILTLILLILGSSACVADEAYPVGDVGNCFPGKDIKRFEVLPGGGWDNLRNIPGGRVASFNYSLCRLTEDKVYIIPDNTYVSPVKQSRMDSFAEIIKHWSDYKSTTATSVNVGASFSGFGVSVSGSFSYEHQQVKDQQVKDSSSTVRVTLKQHLYTMALQPGFQLHPHFKARLLDVARHIEGNNTRMADYELDLLVRDYGTHVITSVDAGASLSQLQQIRSKYLQDHEKQGTSVEVKVSASAQFFVSVGFHSDVKHSSSNEQTKGYSDSLTHSEIKTFGGPPFRSNFSLNDWERGVPNALVAIDRTGLPLNFVINKNNMHELNEVTLYRLTYDLERAIGRYFKFNTVLGCTDHNSPAGFDFQANVDDGSCNKKIGRYVFGGVFQEISTDSIHEQILHENTDRLKELVQRHPITGKFSCPEGFKTALLKKGTLYSSRRYCDCVDGHAPCTCRYIVLATYTSYWCYRFEDSSTSTKVSGLRYGGIYTSTVSNPVTETHGCPGGFYPLHIGLDIKVCVGDPLTKASEMSHPCFRFWFFSCTERVTLVNPIFDYSQPFAGFLSCQAGNPLLFGERNANGNAGSVESFFEHQPPSTWPNRCPLGYSQHLVAIEDDCEISVCTRSMGRQALKIKRPPFQRPPQLLPMTTLQPAALAWKSLTKTGQQWTNIGASLIPESEMKPMESSITAGASTGLQSGQIAGISIGVTLLVATVILLIVIGLKRREWLGYSTIPASSSRIDNDGIHDTIMDHIPYHVHGGAREQPV
ncbi:macrophage-expressed gene 1 protein-like [Lineus longissimus]|uniref:macrophage-expressed gene 1 protein-like n=1 Tax=Lineus longissimus TaxID=88925 RepID=UPI00315D767C